MARPTKYDDITEKFILDALKAGCIEQDAAEAAGVDYATFRRWKSKNAQFRAAVAKAKAEAKAAAVVTIRKAWGQSWKAAAWWLERRYSAEWGKVDRVEVTVRQVAERLASDLGCTADELIAEAEAIVRESQRV
jgi:hypothetical protein